MASELFNTLTGYSVGIPPVPVIDETGNVVSNFLSLTGNVTANKVYANSFFYANGQPFNPRPGGNNTQLQFNNNGILGGIPNVTWNGNILSLGDISTLNISGGVNGYFLQTDGTGNLTWAAGGNGGGNGSPGGANTQIQFNDAGTFGGDAGFTYNKNTNTLYVENISAGNSPDDTITAEGTLNVIGNISVTENITANGNITADYFIGNGSQLTGVISTTGNANYANYAGNAFSVTGSNVSGQVSNSLIAGTVYTNAQPNVTSLGNLLYLNINGDTTSLGNINISGSFSGSNLNLVSNLTAANATFSNKVIVNSNLTVNTSAVLRVSGNVNTAGSPNISLGTLSNIHINGGTEGQVLSTDGTGNLYWATGTAGNIVPGGNTQSVQFNSGGDFGGDNTFVYDTGTGRLTVPQIRSNTTANFQGATNVNLGNVANLRISGGLNGYVLSTDGSSNLSWVAQSGGGGNGSPGGANTQIQYNDSGTFGGSAFLTFNEDTNVFQVAGSLIANSFQMGAGVYKWSTGLVYFASTASADSGQLLYSIPVANLSGVDFEIIATEPAGPSRQSCKISSLYYNGTVQYTEYASLFVNGGVGNFDVVYNGGNIIVPPSLELRVTPNSANPISYKMLITVYGS